MLLTRVLLTANFVRAPSPGGSKPGNKSCRLTTSKLTGSEYVDPKPYRGQLQVDLLKVNASMYTHTHTHTHTHTCSVAMDDMKFLLGGEPGSPITLFVRYLNPKP